MPTDAVNKWWFLWSSSPWADRCYSLTSTAQLSIRLQSRLSPLSLTANVLTAWLSRTNMSRACKGTAHLQHAFLHGKYDCALKVMSDIKHTSRKQVGLSDWAKQPAAERLWWSSNQWYETTAQFVYIPEHCIWRSDSYWVIPFSFLSFYNPESCIWRSDFHWVAHSDKDTSASHLRKPVSKQ